MSDYEGVFLELDKNWIVRPALNRFSKFQRFWNLSAILHKRTKFQMNCMNGFPTPHFLSWVVVATRSGNLKRLYLGCLASDFPKTNAKTSTMTTAFRIGKVYWPAQVSCICNKALWPYSTQVLQSEKKSLTEALRFWLYLARFINFNLTALVYNIIPSQYQLKAVATLRPLNDIKGRFKKSRNKKINLHVGPKSRTNS